MRIVATSITLLVGLCLTALAVGAFAGLPMVRHPTARGQTPLEQGDEATLLALINEYRAQHGVWPLTESLTLSSASQWLSEDMAEHDYLDHVDSLGRDPSGRMADFGYRPSSCWAELLSAAGSPQEAFESWRDSPVHNAVMLDGWLVAGVGKASEARPPYRSLWTVDLRGYQDSIDAALIPTPTPGQIAGCPPAGKWSLAVWTGEPSPAEEAFATCTTVPVNVAYWLDPQTQEWKRYFDALPEISSLTTLNTMQIVIALGGEPTLPASSS